MFFMISLPDIYLDFIWLAFHLMLQHAPVSSEIIMMYPSLFLQSHNRWYDWISSAAAKSFLTWISPRIFSRFTSYLMTKSPSIMVLSHPGHFCCCSSVGEKEMCACKTQDSRVQRLCLNKNDIWENSDQKNSVFTFVSAMVVSTRESRSLVRKVAVVSTKASPWGS